VRNCRPHAEDEDDDDEVLDMARSIFAISDKHRNTANLKDVMIFFNT
jgi:hypothetical protein